MNRARTAFVPAAAVLALLAMSACSGGGGTGESGGDSGPHKGGTLTILTQSDQIDHLDPQRDYVGEDFAFESAYLVRTLTAYKLSPNADEATQLVGDLAKGTGKPSDGGRTWAFGLRSGAKWQDGSPVTCADIKYGISRTFAQTVITDGPTYAIQFLDIPKAKDGTSVYKGPYEKSGNNTAAYDKAVECSADGSTITFHLNRPVGDFNYTVSMPAFGAVPKAKDTGEQYDDDIFSDGPYKISEYSKGEQLVLVRNPHWSHKTDPYRPAYPDKIVMKFSLQPTVIDQRMKADAGADQMAISRDQLGTTSLSEVFNDSRYASRRVNVLNPYVYMLAINSSHVTSLKQRQAIQVALNRAQILKIDGGKYAGDLADGVISPNLAKDYAKTGLWTTMFGQKIPPTGDPALAKKLIKESGKPMPTITYDYATSPVEDKEAASIKASLARAGINVDLNPLQHGKRNEFELNPKTENELEWTAWASDWPNASTVIPSLFETGGGWSMSRANDKQFDKRCEAAKAQLNRDKQSETWKQLNKEAMAKAWAVPVRYGRAQRLAGSKIGTAQGKNGHVYMWTPDGSWPYADLYVKG
ncbi:MAG: ABC transporter substrate-binding protein [Streptosporangiales bacterium]